jgi:uncharacterized protein
MKLENEFTVPAPVEQVWPALLDIGRVAECLPGATIEPGPGDGVFRGRMRIKLGPVTTVYEGTARLQDVDEDTHTASIAVSAREAKGQGTASAVITNRLEAVDGSTRVVAGTDVAITGRQAQFGRGIMQDVAGAMMGQFAQRFEQQLRENGASGVAPAAAAADEPAVRADRQEAPRSQQAEPEPLDVGNALMASPQIRYAAFGVGVLALLATIVLSARRRTPKGVSVELHFRP